jgi:thiosulfate reductase cytochrome b subunit
LATVHSLVAWLFGAFLIGHVYLITTGPTPLAYLRSMISGWERGAEIRSEEQEYERTAA